MSKLRYHHLKPSPGSSKSKLRKGRGESGKRGKTAGRGTKGTGARKTVPAYFEGGQIPLYRRIPKLRGLKNKPKMSYVVVNVSDLQAKNLEGEVNIDTLKEMGLTRKKGLVKILGNGELTNTINLKSEDFKKNIKERFEEFRDKRIKTVNEITNFELEKRLLLQTIDFLWRSHLQYLEHLRQVVGLRGYASKDPLEEFKREAFKLFESLLNKIKIDFITFLNNLEIVSQEETKSENSKIFKDGMENNPKCLLRIKKNEKISRNEKCLATGKKYKHCCGAL